MNETATRILAQIEVRKNLLLSLRQPEGCYVQSPVSEPTGLYWGTVDGIPALVPVEHAERVSQTAISTMRVRDLHATKLGAPSTFIPLTVAIGEALTDLEAEVAWVREGGGG